MISKTMTSATLASSDEEPPRPIDPMREEKIAFLEAIFAKNATSPRGTEAEREAWEREADEGMGRSTMTPKMLAELYVDAEALGEEVPFPEYRERFGAVELVEPDALRELAGVPKALRDAARCYRPTPALSAYAEELRGAEARSAWLHDGDEATLAAAWLAGFVPGALYVDTSEELAAYSGTGQFGPEGANARAGRLASPSLLVLDRPDLASWSPPTLKVVAPRMRHRRMNGLPTIVTASCDLPALRAKLESGARTDEARGYAMDVVRSVHASMGKTPEERAAHVIQCKAQPKTMEETE